jgi:hypothetical protein
MAKLLGCVGENITSGLQNKLCTWVMLVINNIYNWYKEPSRVVEQHEYLADCHAQNMTKHVKELLLAQNISNA